MTIFAKTPVPSETEIQSMELNLRVNRGIRLQRIVQRADAELSVLKTSFRIAADESRALEKALYKEPSSPVHFLGSIGTCKVTYKGDSCKAKDDMDATELKNKIPAMVYYNLFDEVTIAKPCKDFKKKLEKLSPETRAAVMEYFQNVPNSPAVEFSK